MWTGDTELVAQEACRATHGVQVAFCALQRSLFGVVNPLRMVKFHPIGTVVSVGTIAAVGTATLTGRSARAKSTGVVRSISGWLKRAATGFVLDSIVSRIVIPAVAESAASESGSELNAC